MSGIHEGPLIQSELVKSQKKRIAANSVGSDISLMNFSRDSIDRWVSSLCPVCLKVIPAHILEENGKVFMEKQCDTHGEFREIYWSDASLYKKFIKYLGESNSQDRSASEQKGCPFDCGLCNNHITNTLLGNIDLTSRCNMSCPTCFADADGHNPDPSLDQIAAMMRTLRAEKPVPCPAVQFSGGEPTLREDLPQIIDLARRSGFSQIQLATNGLRLASSPEFCASLQHSGLNTVYLQFDGVTPEPYLKNRGRDILPIKKRALENMITAGIKCVVLVPTLAKGINDHQVGDIVRFASKNIEIVRGVNFQPVSFTGRIDAQERTKKRITIPDFIALLEEQTNNEITRDDFYPIPFIVPISQLIAAESEKFQPVFSIHPCCGAATYLYKFDGRLIPLTRFLDVEGLLERIRTEIENYNGSTYGKLKMKGMILREIPKFVDARQAPRDLNATRMLIRIFRFGTRESLREFHNRMLFIGSMHFQDRYNLDLERLQRCGIHYATPDGRVIPFCAYNIIYR
jgi:uncharacterized radical SAM superfamily Fe-S cluster-containing enzyme